MSLTDKIKIVAIERNETFASIERLLSLGQGTIRKWDNSSPSVDKLKKVANVLDVSIDWLVDNHNTRDIQLLNDFNRLDEKEKTLVLERIQTLLDLKKQPEKQVDKSVVARVSVPMPASELEAVNRIIEIRVFDERASAGLGNYLLGDSTYEMLGFDKDIIPPRASIGIRITGDSMEPIIPNNSIVWVEEMAEIPNGQIGVFVLNNEDAFCKRLRIDHRKREILLISINPKYKPIKISSGDFLRTIGRVVGEPYIF